MTSPIFDELERILGSAGLELHDDADRVKTWLTRHIHPHPYHQQQQNTERTPDMGLADTIRQDFTAGLDYAEGLIGRLKTVGPDLLVALDKGDQLVADAEATAARLERYVNEPLVEDVLGVLENVPIARAVLAPVLDGLKAVAAAQPAAQPAAPVEAAPAEPAPAA